MLTVTELNEFFRGPKLFSFQRANFYVHATTIIFLLFTLLLSFQLAAVVLVLYATLIIQGLSRILAARGTSAIVREDWRFYFFGGDAKIYGYEDPMEELQVEVSGIFAAALCLLTNVLVYVLWPTDIVSYCALAVAVVTVLSMVPIFPLPGGRCLRAFMAVWLPIKTAGKITFGVSLVLAMGVVGLVAHHQLGGGFAFLTFVVLSAGALQLFYVERHRDAYASIWVSVLYFKKDNKTSFTVNNGQSLRYLDIATRQDLEELQDDGFDTEHYYLPDYSARLISKELLLENPTDEDDSSNDEDRSDREG